ncbi:MAG: VOC family protein [Proteobacteria bacterium]|nr:VOC family protein [Pseudomonadota bacterium]
MTDVAEAPQAAAPEILGGVAPYLMVPDASAASDFYQRAFAAEEVARQGDGQGRFMHIHLRINGGSVMLSDPFPEHGCPHVPPQGFNLHIESTDPQAWFDRAVAAGATVVLPVQVMFWGAKYGQVKDPYDVLWAFGGPA